MGYRVSINANLHLLVNLVIERNTAALIFNQKYIFSELSEYSGKEIKLEGKKHANYKLSIHCNDGF